MGFDVVLRDAFAVGVPQPEEELRIGVALLGRLAEPDGGFNIILRDATTLGVH